MKGIVMAESASDGAIFVVGVDGSEASVEALRQAQRLAAPVGAKILATAYWDDPQVYAGYVAMGIDRFEERVMIVLNKALEQAFGDDIPPNVIPRVVRGHPRDSLIDASRHADMIVVGRRGHGRFGGLLLGSVSSACVAHAHCPVLVVHSPDKRTKENQP
jgi:nucleotide-binding universal stress UspA family protein